MKTNLYDLIFLKICDEISKLSKCAKIKVGSLIVLDKRIISMGYNGTPTGYDNCNEVFTNITLPNFRENHRRFAEEYEIHAEMNAILYSAKNGININGATLYCSLQPCWNCTKNILQSGIKRIVFSKKWERLNDEERLIEFVKQCNIEYNYIKLEGE